VLIDQLQVTTCRALVLTDRRAIFAAMRRLRPHPELEEIAFWQDHARDRLGQGEATADPSGDAWEGVASFVVSFERSGPAHDRQLRLVVEQTELEVEQRTRTWPDWNCHEICGWMTDQLRSGPGLEPDEEGLSDSGAGWAPQADQHSDRAPATPLAAPISEENPRPPRLWIDRAEIVEGSQRIAVIADGAAVANKSPLQSTRSGRLELTIGGATPDHEVEVVVRLRRPRGSGGNPYQVTAAPRDGAVAFDLSQVPAGQFRASLVAWTPDRWASPALIKLPLLSIT
jgi:hypothetical protein